MIREGIREVIETAIKNAQAAGKLSAFGIPDVRVEKPPEEVYGDYATNIAMVVNKLTRKPADKIAETIKKYILEQKPKGTWILKESPTIKKPGFINFLLNPDILYRELENIINKENSYGRLNFGKNIKTNIEFISANPTGLLHLGNGRGAFLGDCLANVLEKAGYKVTREYLINDAKVNTQIRLLGKTTIGKGTIYLNKYLSSKIKKLQSKIKNKSEGEAGYLIAQEIQKDNQGFIDNKLKIKFNNWISEEKFYKKNQIKKIYQFLKTKQLIYQKGGAVWLKTSKFGAPKDEVILRQTGEPTYFLSDIAYHKDKFDRGFKKIIDIWGADHQGHVPKIKAISKILGYKGQLDILISQMVRLKRGKISKRRGEIITLESLIDEVGLDAARFFYLMKSLGTQMEFDVELAKERSTKSPVYYVQYAHARICSILRKATSHKLKAKSYDLLNHPSELTLIKQLIRFPEIIEDTTRDYQIQRIPQYAIDLATSFHQFYRDCRVLSASHRTKGSGAGSEDKELTKARLSLVSATKIVLKNTLNLMGISAPGRM